MNTTGTILKNFRKNRLMTQQELSRGIVSRQTYSKIENGDIQPNFEILNSLLIKLDYELSDFAFEYKQLKNNNSMYHIYQKGIAKKATKNEIIKLNTYIHKNYKKSKRNFYLYGITKGHLRPIYPDLIPKFTSEDEDYFKKLVMKPRSIFNLYDLKLIGNFSGHLLSYEDILSLYYTLPDFSPYDYGDDFELYHSEIHKIFNNFCDIAIYNNDIPTAKEILKTHTLFTEINKDFRFFLYIKINELAIDFKETRSKESISNLKNILKTITLLDDEEMAKALKYQIKVLETDSEYISFKAITHN